MSKSKERPCTLFIDMSCRILIIDALSAGTGQRRSSRDSIGCGPRTVAGIFEKHSLDSRIHRAEEVLSRPRILKQFDHLAVSAMSMDYPAVKMLVKQWRSKTRVSGKIILGGPIASAPRILKDLAVDLLVIGEGEATLEELVLGQFFDNPLELSTVKGIAYLEDEQIHVTQHREFISSDMLSRDYFPSITRIIDYPAYQASKIYVEVTRGCSNFRRTTLPLKDGRHCTDCGNCDSENPDIKMECPEDIPPGCGFCSVPSTWGPPRSRLQEVIVREVKELLNLGVHRIVLESPGFLDYMRGSEPLTDPCYPPANLDAIRNLLSQLNSLPQVMDKTAHIAIENMKACLFTNDVAKTLTESMMSSSPNIGLETGSERHLRAIGKCGSVSDVLSAVKIAVNHGMKPFVYFIYGLPGEDAESTKESIKAMREISEAGAERIILYGFRPLPGSAFEEFSESSTRDEFSFQLRREAERINRKKKNDYVGLVVRGIAAEPSWAQAGYTMIYPLKEGPLMTVMGGFSAGILLNVRILKVLSSGLVEGEVVSEPESRS
ncbi:MAG: B12-binding domain-containing radical SAM protein [Candidatus Odinarchaeota archaeon]